MSRRMASNVSTLSGFVANSHQTVHLVSSASSKIPYGGFSLSTPPNQLNAPLCYWLGNHIAHQSGTGGSCNEAAAFILCHGLDVLLALLRSGRLLLRLLGPGHPAFPSRL